MGALVLGVITVAAGTIVAVVAQHYLRLALKRWIASDKARKD